MYNFQDNRKQLTKAGFNVTFPNSDVQQTVQVRVSVRVRFRV